MKERVSKIGSLSEQFGIPSSYQRKVPQTGRPESCRLCAASSSTLPAVLVPEHCLAAAGRGRALSTQLVVRNSEASCAS